MASFFKILLITALSGGAAWILPSCGGNIDIAVMRYSIGGMVSGLSGNGLVLQNNGGDNLSISSNGSFTFSTSLVSGAAYNVTVLTKPSSPSQSCSVDNAAGTIGSFNVANVTVVCGLSGSLDTGFNSTGKVTTAIGANDVARGVAVQSDGKIVAAGYNGTTLSFTLVRYNKDGSLDTTFGLNGIVTTPVGLESRAYAIAIQSNGKIIAAGESWNGSSWDTALARYNANGTLDTSFDTDGIVTTDIGVGRNDGAFGVAIHSDGKIVVSGYAYNGSNNDFALAQYNANGSLDTTFDADGMVATAIGTSDALAYSVAIQTDGKIVAAGYSFIGSNSDFTLARYNTNGSLDTNFNLNGIVTTAIGTGFAGAYGVAIQSDGKIVAAGYSNNGSNSDFTLARYNVGGSLDATFDTDGIVTTAVGTGNSTAYSVALQSDGKIVAAGYSTDISFKTDFALVRYNTNGSLDPNFNTAGIVITAIGSNNDVAYSVAIHSNGKIVGAGSSYNGANDDFALAVYWQ